MSFDPDPFCQHPELRGAIIDPEQPFFRTLTIATLEAKMKSLGMQTKWWHVDEKREAMRAEALAADRGNDLWAFTYGSLMWDPIFHFAEVRRVHTPDHAQRFILKDILGGRGE